MEVAVEQAAQSRSRRSKWPFMGTSDAGAKEELHRVYCAKEDLLPIPCFSQLLSYDSNSELPPAVSYFGDEYTFNLETQETLVHSKSHLFYAVVYLPQKVSDSMLVSRTTWEGGQYNRDEKSRLDALCLAMELGADHIDVELQVPFFSVGANGAAVMLPQLRRVTSMELGCDPKGYSHAGNNTTVWYFAVLIGRQTTDSLKCVKVQEILSAGENVNQIDQHQAAMSALKEKRLTFAWVDSEAQKEKTQMTSVDRMAGANIPSLAAMEQTRMLAHI
ncbi:unnamed protein product [Lactuca saligna]|uniref:Uncharacterized protein n=1 Tax=Lactuca saligna TaxID=75948 RepID=A0AA35YTL9_LACSI|nr:unnamed protein product [Lactuca saligna]